jgi:hypothetical protein
MHNLAVIEECYKKFIKSLNFWIPEGIYYIDLQLLHHFDLLHFQPHTPRKDPVLTRYFHMVESPEKITLINDEFVVWIIPDKVNYLTVTYTLIALNPSDREPQLEAAFIASGIYNTSKLVLKVLEKFLIEIQETETALLNFPEETA